MIPVCYGLLALAAACFGFRMLRGPYLADRVIALDGILVVGVSSIALHAMDTRSGAFLPVAVVVTLVGFISTAVVARFIEGQGG